MQDLISVIVPVYKVEKYLKRCVDSILAQTYPCLEVILVDDGSPDGCPAICDEYAREDRRVRVIHKENGGLSDARNAGIDAAKGNFLGFIDSDDYVHPRFYELLLQALKEEGADIAGCDVKKIYETGTVEEEEKEAVRSEIYSGREATANLYDAQLYLKSVVIWNKLYKKELFKDVRFPKGKLHEDEFTSYRLLYQSKSVVYIDRAYYFYFQREDGIMGQKQKKISPVALEAYEQMETFFREKGEKDLLQMMMYRYLSMVRRYASDAVKSKDEEEVRLGRYYDKKFRRDYRKYIWKIRKPKRKFRLWMYYHFKICI
jgi:glycosyltransferase involved in cell wall biosynthesis